MKLKLTIAVSLTLITAGLIACSTLPTGNVGKTLTTVGNQLTSSTTAPTNKNTHKPPRFFLKSAFKGTMAHPFDDKEMGIDVTDLNFNVGVDEDGDGGENEHTTATIAVKNAGTHKLKLDANLFPTMSDKEDTLVLTDIDTGNVRIYGADKDFQRYHIHDGKDELLIETNPDGTWLVNGQAAKTPKEVVKLAMKLPILANASLHGLAMLYELAKNRNNITAIPPELILPKTLQPTNCDGKRIDVGEIGDPTPLLEEAVLEMEQKAATTQPTSTSATPSADAPVIVSLPMSVLPPFATDNVAMSGMIRGKVFDSTNTPIAALTVAIESTEPKVRYNAVFDVQGTNDFFFNKVPVMIPLKLTVMKSGYKTIIAGDFVVRQAFDPNLNPNDNPTIVTFNFGSTNSTCGSQCALQRVNP